MVFLSLNMKRMKMTVLFDNIKKVFRIKRKKNFKNENKEIKRK